VSFVFDTELLSPRRRVADNVYELIVSAVLRGELRAGSRLSVPGIAARLAVSRTPVREAIQRLVREGLAVEEPHRGAVIATFDTRELIEIYELREVLEGLAARLAATRIDEPGLAALRHGLAEHRAAVASGDTAAHFELDLRFHRLVSRAAGNANLARSLDLLQSRIRLAMLSTSVTAGPSRALADHEAIVDAIASRDAARAETAARGHIARLAEVLRARDAPSPPRDQREVRR
jgi:DNA-binding GntR family transcriptional regulator